MRAGAPAAALFLAVVAGLYFDEVRPQIEDRVYRGSDGRPFHLPTYLPGDCPFYRATALSLLREKDLDLHDDMAWNVVRPQGQVALGARGEWYPKHPILLPLAALPFYASLGDQGLLAFNVLTSVMYAGAAFVRRGPVERDTHGMAVSANIGEPWIGVTILAPAVLDGARYYRPHSRRLTWASRAAKIGGALVILKAAGGRGR